ncbi:MAG: protocatechuate 3,4-dioxygenase subunit beta [Gammaproteobacteria bacterium]|nr:protocatechuate 3,4-dioxygenase subunit beta [Gammaproteobacteria bacterium]MDD9895120.1 protocatechuate 3,4-dioxygenase subunit beta [Gammaproteobacteria bacterium]MDD9959502.1 protocatechuate 3,4-dioxygenase subunit beta [Gammaproteobacteria bacterium]
MSPIDLSQHPPFIYPDYKSSVSRGPLQSPIDLVGLTNQRESGERSGSLVNRFSVGKLDHDLIRNGQQGGLPLGERMVVSGCVVNQWGKPEAGVLVEAWQANASGRYAHRVDQHDAPIDPNFLGVGRCVTDRDGNYRFYTIKPGAYPWKNHPNAWRPQHIHFSLIGETIADRLVTQMYFPGDPLLEYDPIFSAVPANARERLISNFDLGITEADFALGYRFDIVLAGINATPVENDLDEGGHN